MGNSGTTITARLIMLVINTSLSWQTGATITKPSLIKCVQATKGGHLALKHKLHEAAAHMATLHSTGFYPSYESHILVGLRNGGAARLAPKNPFIELPPLYQPAGNKGYVP